MVAAYRRAERELRVVAEAAWERGAEGTAAYYARQHDAVVKILGELQDEVIPLMAEDYAQAYARGVGDATVQMRNLQVSVATDFAGVHTESVNAAIAAQAVSMNEVAESIGRQTPDALRQIGLEATAQHQAQGRTITDTMKALRKEMAIQGMTEFRDRAGRRWSLTRYSKMVARTTTREAQTTGFVTQMQSNSLDLVTVSSHADPCDLCAEFDGNTYSLSGDTEGYDTLDEVPPFHPNCRHVLTAAAANLDLVTA